MDGAYDVFMWILVDLLHLSKGEFSHQFEFLTFKQRFLFGFVKNSLFLGAKTFEGIMSQREHVNDGKVPQECHHLQGDCHVSDQS